MYTSPLYPKICFEVTNNHPFIRLGEKELDCDPGWEKEHMVHRFADIIDLNEGERAVMAKWNSFLPVHWRGVLKHMDALAIQFVREKGGELAELGLYRL